MIEKEGKLSSNQDDRPSPGDTFLNSDERPDGSTDAGQSEAGHQKSADIGQEGLQDEVDEFGLQVKRLQRRSTSTLAYETASEDNDSTNPDHETKPESPAVEQRDELHETIKTDVAPVESHDGDSGSPTREKALSKEAKEAHSPIHKPKNSEAPCLPPTVDQGSNDGLNAPDREEALSGEAREGNISSHRPTKSDAPSLPATEDILVGNTGAVSGWSHQALAPQKVDVEEKKAEDQWQTMPSYARYDLYDDDDRLIAREAPDSDEEANAYHGLGGAGKGYTRVQDDDAKSTTSMDENTDYLFKTPKGTDLNAEDDDQRDPLAQLQATKELLTEGQRIAYVGVTRLAFAEMVKELVEMDSTRSTKKAIALTAESAKMWSQKMMVRLYIHMDISSSEQVMIEQLAEHGVLPADLTPALMQNARVKNPMADEAESLKSPDLNAEKSRTSDSPCKTPDLSKEKQSLHEESKTGKATSATEELDDEPLPPYREHDDNQLPEAGTPTHLGTSKNIDIDIRWTILCDLFLVLLSDSVYDARSRTLLERVGESLEVSWLDICRFEKRVTDALEMQEEANKETWDEAEHLEHRRKLALKRRYMMMGLATVGGSLVIGLSAGLLAPVIGAGLAAGFTTIGVAGTSGFLAGAGGAALITSTAVLTGGTIAVRASNRRTGAVSTFEYRPLHNNKRVNLILTISGWMAGKVDDVRLPFSTVDPVMGDIYSLLWEPEMLQSMGQTINILANEALSQTVQQVLGSTILVALMSALQLPIVLTKLSYLIDNPWTVSMARANAAGLILADSLIDRNLGMRPITLVGFSLGARVIFAALRELSKRGAVGLIQNVYLFGSPIVANKDEYLRARSVISGRFVNGYASNDWILGYLFRATSGGIMRVAGLAQVENIPGLENYDVTELVNGHMAYRTAMPKLLRKVGWEIESDEFTEIEDPDPEDHGKRQRELIHEIEEARKDAEEKPEKKRFGFFKRSKPAAKKKWETYDDSVKENGGDDFSTSAAEGQNGNVLFDIEAIKRELESEAIEVKQLESTMPPMKLDSHAQQAGDSPYATLRETKSFDGTMAHRSILKDADTGSQSAQVSSTNVHNQAENPFNRGYDKYNISQDAIKGKPGGRDPQMSLEAPKRSPSPYQPSPSLHQNHAHPSTPPQRPSMRTSLSSPGSVGGLESLDRNAWADEDDPDFGKEQEVKLTF